MSDDLRDVQPLTGAVLGALLLGGGLTIVFIALEWIHVDPATIHVPRWVFGIGAVLVGLFTVWGLVYGIRRIVAEHR